MESGRSVDALYIDFSRAIDSLNHSLLVEKLKKYGVPTESLQWFSSYLSGRSLQVRVDYNLSTVFSAMFGVPQGSHLRPILFLIYVQDLTAGLNVNHSMYADDLKLSWKMNGLADHQRLQRCLDQVARWGILDDFGLNPLISQAITFSRRRSHILHRAY